MKYYLSPPIIIIVLLFIALSAFLPLLQQGLFTKDQASWRQVACSLNGAETYMVSGVHAGELGIAGNKPRSIELWVMRRFAGDDGGVFSLGADDSPGESFSLRALASGPRPERRAPSVDAWQGWFGNDSSPLYFFYPAAGRWVHFALVHTGEETIIYVDGTEMARRQQKLNTSDGEPFRAGWWSDEQPEKSFAGKIAEVRIWSKALEESDIRSRMKKKLDGNEDGLVAYWPLNEASGKIAKDWARGNHGQFNGSPEWFFADPFEKDLPAGKVFTEGESVTLGPVKLRDAQGPVSYQWYFNNEPVLNANDDRLIIDPMRMEDIGWYHVVADDDREITPAVSGKLRLSKPDWPMWRYDAERSADTPLVLHETLHLQWKRELPEPDRAWPHQWDDWGKLDFDISYSPVAKNGQLFVPSNVTDGITAYNIVDGTEQWRFYADGPVRLAPVAWQDRVYFVSDDGHLYCVRAKDGEPVWKFRGGPSDLHLLGNERLINMWPARGAPVIKDGIIYFAAGVWPMHGVFIYALDALSGDIVWVNDTTSSDYLKLFRDRSYGGLAPQGYIAASEDHLVVAGGRTPPAFLDRHTGEFISAKFTTEKPSGDYAVNASGLVFRRETGPVRPPGAPNASSMRVYGRWDAAISTGESIINKMLEDRVESLAHQIDGQVFYKLAAHNRLIVTTDKGTLYCFGPEKVEPVVYSPEPERLVPRTNLWADTAKNLLAQHADRTGYVLILGKGSGDLMRELVLRSNMHIIVVEKDKTKARKLRDELFHAGMYGRRAAVIQADPAHFSVQPYLFSMVLAEDAEAAGLTASEEALGRILEALTPYRGTAWLGARGNAAKMAEMAKNLQIDQIVVENRTHHLSVVRNGPLTNAGTWTHQYHDAANTLLSKDSLVRLPLGILWFGGPGHDNVLPRHAGGPRPQIAGGRQIFLGVETLAARCVYTGRALWEREFPGIGHPFTDIESEKKSKEGHLTGIPNQPGATYIGSPLVTLSDAIYLRYHRNVYHLDPATGETVQVISLPGRSVSEIYNDQSAPEWGHISVQGDYLITTVENHVFEERDLGISHGYSGTSSRILTAINRHNGQVLWMKQASTGFRHGTIVSADERIFVIDGLSENAIRHFARRGTMPGETSQIMALDIQSGEVLWNNKSNVFGTFLIFSDQHDILVEGGSVDMRTPFEDEPRNMTARCGSTGNILWERGGRFVLPGAIRNDKIIPGRPSGPARSLLTGEDWQREQPLTGEKGYWTYSRRKGCNTLNASEHLLLFRSVYAAFFDLQFDSGTGFFSGVASGCSASMIAADGVLNSLDYRRTCLCSYPHQTSMALVHMPEDFNIELWTRYDASRPDPNGYGINFGAPGRRIDYSTTWVWHNAAGTSRRHPSALSNDGEGIKWVASSAREGEGEISFGDLVETTYTLRLHFAELQSHVESGQRLFDVFVDGKKVLKDYDIVAQAGAALKGTVERFTLDVMDGRMNLELRRSADSDLDPLISGVELFIAH